LPPRPRIDHPSRIYQHQVVRPKDLREIEPESAAGDQDAIDRRKLEHFSLCVAELPLHPTRADGCEDADKKKGNQRHDVSPPFELAAFPPEEKKHESRQVRRNRLGK
jgi:hypothetical protein